MFCSSPVVMLSVETRQGRVRAPSHTPVVCNVETILVPDTVTVSVVSTTAVVLVPSAARLR